VHWRELYAVAAYTYLRAGELRALVWDDIDLERRMIRVTKAVERSTHVVKPTKTGHTRQVPIEPTLVPLLEKMHKQTTDGQAPVLWMPPDRKQATALRTHLKLAHVTRRSLLHSEGRRSMHLTFHDLRAGGTTYCAVRNDRARRRWYRPSSARRRRVAGSWRVACPRSSRDLVDEKLPEILELPHAGDVTAACAAPWLPRGDPVEGVERPA
jgi:integrase